MDEFANLPWRQNLLESYTENNQSSFLDDSHLVDFQPFVEFKTKKLTPPKKKVIPKPIAKPERKSKRQKLNRKKDTKPQPLFIDFDNPSSSKDCSLSLADKKWYLSYLINMQNAGDKSDKKTLNFNNKFLKLKDSINKERDKFLEIVKERWVTENYKRYYDLSSICAEFINCNLKSGYECVKNYLQFYKPKSIINLSSNQDDCDLSVTPISILCQQGNVPQMMKFRDSVHYELSEEHLSSKFKIEPNNDIVKHSVYPVSMDPKALQLAKEYNADIVISLESLKVIINEHLNNWTIPIVIKEVNSKIIIFIDEPIAGKNMSNFTKRTECFKEITRNFFCNEIGFKFNFDVTTKQTESENETIADEEIEQHYHNVTYEQWEMKPENRRNILRKGAGNDVTVKVLIRSSLDCLDASNGSALVPINLCPKIQLQPEYGSEENSFDDLLGQWCDMYFKKCSQLIKVHIDGLTSNVMLMEKNQITNLIHELVTHHKFKAADRFYMMYNLFTSLMSNPSPGTFILRPWKQKMFLELLDETEKDNDKDDRNIYDLWSDYEDCQRALNEPSKISELKLVPWRHIDTMFIMPWHKKLKRPPGIL